MPKTRQNKNRKENLTNFKNQQKKQMDEKNDLVKPNLKIIKQPTWQSTELFQITGAELETLANFFAPYKDSIGIIDRIMGIGELQGKVYNTILYEDGSLVPDSDPRFKEIKEEDEKRIANWKELIQKRTEEMESLKKKSEDVMNDIENIEKKEVVEKNVVNTTNN